MAFINGPWIELNEDEMRAFSEQMHNPDREAIQRRDAFINEIYQHPWHENDDGSYELEFDFEVPTRETTASSPMKNLHFENTYLQGGYTGVESGVDNTTELMAA